MNFVSVVRSSVPAASASFLALDFYVFLELF